MVDGARVMDDKYDSITLAAEGEVLVGTAAGNQIRTFSVPEIVEWGARSSNGGNRNEK
jgi:hypothetical protein